MQQMPQVILSLLQELERLRDDESAISLVHELLLRLRNEDVKPSLRYEVLEQVNQRIENIAFKLRKRALQANGSLLQKSKITRAVDTLQHALASAYMGVFSDVEMNVIDIDLDNFKIAKAMLRAMFHLSQRQVWHYQMYACLPDRMWFNLHFVYREAAAFQLEHLPQEITTVTGKLNTTIEQLYKRCLLLGCANTVGMQPEEIMALNYLLEPYLNNVIIHKPGNIADLYVVFVFSDLGPVYQSITTSRPNLQEAWFSIDTTNLAGHFRKIYNDLEKNKMDYWVVNFHKIGKRNLLKFIQALSALPTRKSERRPVDRPMVLRFHLSHSLTTPEDNFNLTRNYSDASFWETHNVSEAGFCFAFRGPLKFNIQSGQLVTVSSVDGEQKFIGVIRWVRFSTDGTHTEEQQLGVKIGVQILGSEPREVLITQAEKGESAWLMQGQAGAVEPSIILPPNYGLGQRMLVQPSDSTEDFQSIKLVESLEASIFFIRYRYYKIE